MTHKPDQNPDPQSGQQAPVSAQDLFIQRMRMRSIRRKLNEAKKGKTRTRRLSAVMGLMAGLDLAVFAGAFSFLALGLSGTSAGLAYMAFREHEKNAKTLEATYARGKKILHEIAKNRRRSLRLARAAKAAPPVPPALLKLAGQPAQDFSAKAGPVDKIPGTDNNDGPAIKPEAPTRRP